MSDGTSILIGVAVGIAIAGAGGFVVGYRFALSAPARLVRRAGRDVERCLNEAASAVEVAGQLCSAVANASLASERQITNLLERQRSLAEAIERLRSANSPSATAENSEIEWQQEPIDPETDLPDRSALLANIARLMAQAHDGHRGGVLVVSLDGADRLKGRIGEDGLSVIRKSVGRVLVRASRDADLTCRLDAETFAVLMSDADPRESIAQAGAVRDAFRSHPFRLGSDGPELLVTASFGFTPVAAGDDERLLLDRAQAAVVRSRRCGRNRLHAVDPQSGRFDLVANTSRGALVAAW